MYMSMAAIFPVVLVLIIHHRLSFSSFQLQQLMRGQLGRKVAGWRVCGSFGAISSNRKRFTLSRNFFHEIGK